MKLLRLAAIVLAVGLSGCAADLISPLQRDAVKAVAISMSAYDKGVQPQIERYGLLPMRGTPECVAIKVTLLCRDQATFAKLYRADAIASAAIHKARQVIDGVVEDDQGTALTEAATAMHDAETAFVNAAIPGVKP